MAMPLTFVQQGDKVKIVKIGGRDRTKQFLESLGFVTDSEISVVAEVAGNLIVNVKESRVAVSKEMAARVSVEPVAR